MTNPHGSNLELLHHCRDENNPDVVLASIINHPAQTTSLRAGSLSLHRGHRLHHLVTLSSPTAQPLSTMVFTNHWTMFPTPLKNPARSPASLRKLLFSYSL